MKKYIITMSLMAYSCMAPLHALDNYTDEDLAQFFAVFTAYRYDIPATIGYFEKIRTIEAAKLIENETAVWDSSQDRSNKIRDARRASFQKRQTIFSTLMTLEGPEWKKAQARAEKEAERREKEAKLREKEASALPKNTGANNEDKHEIDN